MIINNIVEVDKFHTFILSKYQILKLNKKEAKYLQILASYMNIVNNKYKTFEALHDFFAKNYDLSYQVSYQRYGMLYLLKYEMRGVDPYYVSDDRYNYTYLLKKFNEISKPLIEDNKFSKNFLNKVKKIYQTEVQDELNDNDFKATYYSLNYLFKNLEIDYITLLNKKELKEINEVNLYNFYKRINKEKSYIILAGNNTLENNKAINVKNEYLHAYKNPKLKGGTVIKKYKSTQAYLRIYYNIGIYSGTKDIAKMSMYCYILGQSGYSKLFSIVREKYGLCYDIDCDTDFSTGIFYITSTIKKKDYNKVIDAIDEAIDKSLDDINLEKIKSYFITSQDASYDYIRTYVSNAFYNNNFKDILLDEEYKSYLKEITLDDLYEMKSLLKKKKLIYLFGGDIDEN